MKPNEIKRLRECLGLTQEAFGRLLQVTRFTVMRWETGQSEPRPVYVKILKELK